MEAPSQEEHSGIQHGEVQAIFPSRGKSVQGDTGKKPQSRAGLQLITGSSQFFWGKLLT